VDLGEAVVAEQPVEFNSNGRVAYFSMEIALERGMATYAGGLGVLARQQPCSK
jgi:glucan phosphorylase